MKGVAGRAAALFGVPDRPSRAELENGARIVVCATLSWYLAALLKFSSAPVTAVIPAVLTLYRAPLAAPRLALQRMAGVLLGVVIGVAVLRLLPVSALSLAVLLTAGFLGSLLLRTDGIPSQQVLLSAVLVFGIPLPGYPEERILENLVGIAVVTLLGPWLWPPDPYRILHGRLDSYRDRLNRLLEDLPGRFTIGSRREKAFDEAADLWQCPRSMSQSLDQFRQGVRWHLVRRRSAPGLEELAHRIRLAERTATTLHHFTDQLQTTCHRTADPPLSDILAGLAPVAGAVRCALDRALAGADPAEALVRAHTAIRHHRETHRDQRATVLRSSLLLTIDVLDDFRTARFPGC
ncbi:FUSC family protein [Streptomyces sp. NRRL B-1677]|uniref:FUSC family protein n=1 Tax=Streptomyces sp. NRRL B-1677 TaxID=2682966 RepID=UPI001892B81E|nr:FUSC family protein [Streptomyces sp. NRRL B-1677]